MTAYVSGAPFLDVLSNSAARDMSPSNGEHGKDDAPSQDAFANETAVVHHYFSSVMAPYIAAAGNSNAPIRRIEANVFEAGAGQNRTVLVMRFCSRRMLDRLQNDPPARLLLFIDDNLWALKGSAMPEGYRYRLARKRETIFEPIVAMAHEVISPSRRVLARFDTKERHLVSAGLSLPLPQLDHHESSGTIDIVFCGARSHAEDLSGIAGALAGILEDHVHVTLTTFLGLHAPAVLHCRGARHHAPMRWADYKRFMAGNRFHISITPGIGSEFNYSRSLMRVLDNGIWGAAGVYCNQEPFSLAIRNNVDGILVDREPQAWATALRELIENRDMLHGLAARGKMLAQEMGDNAALARFWLNRLDIMPWAVARS